MEADPWFGTLFVIIFYAIVALALGLLTKNKRE